MTAFRRIRFFTWLFWELATRHTRSLIVGFSVGFVISLLAVRFLPTFMMRLATPVDRIAIIGEFSPTTLPIGIQRKISMGLTTIGNDGYPLAGLADRWESTDGGKLYTFFLKKNLRWHDGKGVSASDINYNIQNVNFVVKDKYTILVKLTTPFSPLPVALAKPLFRPGLQGFGAWRMASIKLKGDVVDYLRLVRADGGRGDAIEYRFYKTQTQAILAFKLGEVDQVESIDDPDPLPGWKTVAVIPQTRYQRIVTLFFNMSHSALKEKSFRQALAHSVPAPAEEPAWSAISKLSWAFTDKVKRYEYDEDLARKLLVASKVGTDSGRLTISTFLPYAQLAQQIADSWTKLGVATTVKVENALTSSYDVLLTAQDLPPDPDQYVFWHSTQSQTNITNYVNVKIDKLLEDGRQKTDPDERKKIYADFQRRLMDDVPILPLYYPVSYTIKRGKL